MVNAMEQGPADDLLKLDAETSRLKAGRSILRRVLARRKLVPNADGEAIIDACIDLETLECWQQQAIFAVSVADALRSPEKAAADARREQVIIVDLVKFGEDRGYEMGRLDEDRAALRRVLTLRKLALDAETEARIAACTDLATLQRWLDQAVPAASAAEALRPARPEPVLIVDLVRIGEDRGWRSALRHLLAVRKLAVGAEAEARIEACMDPATLERWVAQAAVAASPAEVLQ
jgi:hypothetical protein